jgi:modulator of FtsH protease HflC
MNQDVPHVHHHADHDHHHGTATHAKPSQMGSSWMRLSVAGLLIIIALLAATLVVVAQGSAIVITRFGDPVRVQITPGLTWRIPAPIERTVSVDLRLHTTATGLHDVGTKDGLRIQMSAFIAWRVPAEAPRILQHLRSVRGDADEAAMQVRSFLGSALETEVSRYAMADLINAEVAQVKLDTLEQDLLRRLSQQVHDAYGIDVVQVGIERLGLPKSTIKVTVERMIAERQTAAAEKKAKGSQIAADINQSAFRDSRIVIANAEEKAAAIEAKARSEAAGIYAQAHALDPQLYSFLRGLDTLDQIITSGTRIVLRTDAAPFKALVDGPVPPTSQSTSKPASQP